MFSTYTGNAHRSVVDLQVFGSVGQLPLQFIRYSNTRAVPQNVGNAVFGRESVWTHNFQWFMREAGPDPGTSKPRLRVTFPDGSDHFYVRQSAPVDGKATWLSRANAPSILKQNNNNFTVHLDNGNYYRFAKRATDSSETAFFYRLQSFTDAANNTYTLSYLHGRDKLVRRVTDPSDRYLDFTYTEQQAAVSARKAHLAEVGWDEATPGQWHEVNVSNTKKSRYLALFYKNNYRNAPPLPIAEIEFYDENNQLITGTAFGSGPLFDTPHDAAKAFDGNTSTYYRYAYMRNGYVGLDAGSAKEVSKIRYYVPDLSLPSIAAFEFVGLASVAASTPVLAEVSASDGRSVIFNYTTLTDASTWFSWSTLTSVDYPDSTSALYSYTQTANYCRPLMNHCLDPRVRGNGTCIEYSFNEQGSIGCLKEELSGVNQAVIAVCGFDGAHQPKAIYPGGKTVKREYSGSTGNCMVFQDALGEYEYYTYDQSGAGHLASITDKRGHTTSYTRNALGSPLTITHPDGTIETFTYDSRNRVKSHKLSGSGFTTRTTTYKRDSSGRVTEITHPDSVKEYWTYNSYGQILTHTRRNSAVESYSYDSSGLLLSHINSLSGTTSYTHNNLDLVATVTDPLSRTQGYLYNDRGLVTRHIHADSSYAEFEYDDFGNLITRINELGKVWSATYDEFRNKLTETDPLNRTTTYTYAASGGCGACNTSGKPTSVTYPSGRQVEFSYDLEWRLTAVTVAPGQAREATTLYEHDPNGNLTKITAPGGSITSHTYDSRNRPLSTTDPLNFTISRTYDRAGNVLTETRPDSGVTVHTYSKLNCRLTKKDPKNQTTTFTYNAEGQMLTLKDARNQTYSWTYDSHGRVTRKDYPNGSYEAWTYDAAHQRLTARARNAAIDTSSFDSRGRETAIDWSDSTPDIARTFDAAGRLLSSGNGLSTSSYTYDDAGQQLSETQYLHGIAPSLPAYTVEYTYDADGRRDTVTYPGGTEVSYTYTDRGQVETISEDAPPPLATYTYNLNGTRASKALENGVVSSYSYDAAWQLLNVTHSHSSTPFQSRDYLYNNVGNRSAMRIDGGTWDVYGFDAVDQITSVKYEAANSSGSSPARTVSYTWDAVGNRTAVQENISGGPLTSDSYATANAVNQYPTVNGHNLSYDSNGNLTGARLEPQGQAGLYGSSSVPVTALSYDSQNRLLSTNDGTHTVVTTYDTRNRVTSRTINSTTTLFLWDDWNLIEERDASGTLIRRYVHGAGVDEILMMVDASAAKYHSQDALGSVTALTDNTGAVLEHYLYDVFGTAVILDGSNNPISASAVGNRFMYTGREWVAEANLYDYRNRVFSPVLGRFLQTDPIRFDAGDVNLYRYVGNSVLSFRDSTGLSRSPLPDTVTNPPFNPKDFLPPTPNPHPRPEPPGIRDTDSCEDLELPRNPGGLDTPNPILPPIEPPPMP